MKRDMDLIRQLLQKVEAVEHPTDAYGWQFNDHELYHMLLLTEAGFVTGLTVTVCDGGEMLFDNVGRPRLTWSGHEFMDAARSDTVWNEAKQKVGGALGTVSITVLTQVLIQLAKQHIGLPQ